MNRSTVERIRIVRLPLLTAIGSVIAATILHYSQAYATEHAAPVTRPDHGSTISFTGGAMSTGWLSFEMPDYRRVIVSGRINGAPARFLLDSGVSGVVLSREFATELALRTTGSLTELGVTGKVQAELAEGVSISLDKLDVVTSSTEIEDMRPLNGVLNEPIAALIGGDLFENLIVDIDFAKVRLAFWDPHIKRSLPGGSEVPARRDRFGLRGLPVSIEDNPPILATLDFGSDIPVSVSPAYASDHGLLANRKTSTTLAAGAAGSVHGHVALLKTLSIGRLTFHDIPVQVPQAWAFDNQVIFGMPVIRRMRLLIDFPHDHVTLRADPQDFGRPFRKDRSGLGARRLTDRLQIMHVAAGSPAETIGLHVGDEIIAIDDQPLGADYFRAHPRMGSQPPGTVMYLTLSSHARLKLTLADYY